MQQALNVVEDDLSRASAHEDDLQMRIDKLQIDAETLNQRISRAIRCLKKSKQTALKAMPTTQGLTLAEISKDVEVRLFANAQ